MKQRGLPRSVGRPAASEPAADPADAAGFEAGLVERLRSEPQDGSAWQQLAALRAQSGRAGSRVPVVTPAALLALRPDDILVLPWNIGAEIAAQLRKAGFSGGLYIAVPRLAPLP